MKKIIVTALTLSAILVASSCTGGSVQRNSPFSGNKYAVGSVKTSVHESFKEDAAEIQAFVESDLDSTVKSVLKDEGAIGSGSATMEVVVDSIRLRNTAIVYFFGVMAGLDHLSAHVVVSDKGKVIDEFNAEAKIGAGFSTAGIAASQRMNWMYRKLAQEISKEIHQ